MKALEKDRTRRYGSPSDLATDIERHLAHEPVLASPPRTVYRATKFVRRHLVGVASATAIALSLVALLVGMTVQARRIARERDRAEHEAAKSKAVTDFLKETLNFSPYGEHGRDATILEALDEAVSDIDESFDGPAEVLIAVKNAIGWTYVGLGRYDQAEALLEPALRIGETTLGREHPEVAETLNVLGNLRLERGASGDFEVGERHLTDALGVFRKLEGEDSLKVAELLNHRSVLRLYAGDDESAESDLRESLAIYRRILPADHENIGRALSNLAGITTQKTEPEGDELEEAEQMYREALDISSKKVPGGHATYRANLAGLLCSKGEYAEGVSMYKEVIAQMEEALEPGHWHIANAQSVLGWCLTEFGRYKQAEEPLLAALPVLSSVMGEQNSRTKLTIRRLAELYESWGKPEKAAEYRAMLKETEEPEQ
jgi:tetratricopeptide (TPR) repeat protein